MSPDASPQSLRVLQLIETGGPGGAETVFANLATGLAERHHHVACFVGEGNWLPAEMQDRGLSPMIISHGGAFDLALLRTLRRAIREQGIDLVHAHLFDGALYAAMAARLEGVPCVTTLHGQVDVRRAGLRARIKQMIFSRLISCVVSVSDALRRDLRQSLRLEDNQFRVIPNGVGRAQQTVAPTPAHTHTSDVPHLLAVGNIRTPKDYPTMLSALSALVRQGRRLHLDIAGQPDSEGLFEALQQQVRDLDLEHHVTFHGFLADPSPLFAQASAFLLTSTREGFSLATIESMLAGVPVVATRSGGPEEILQDGETGLLVPVGDPRAIAAAVGHLLDHPDEGNRLARNAHAHATARYSLSAMVDAYEALYREQLSVR